jgi:tetratricopeptide (TPR) repeat protein
MKNLRRAAPSRRLLLAATLLCGSASLSLPAEARAARMAGAAGPARGAYTAFLEARFATSQADFGRAADGYLRALAADPSNPELIQSAFAACLVDGRPDAAKLARKLPDNPVALLLLADDEAKEGRWDQAEQRFHALPRQGAAQVMGILQPLLIAWAQAGAGRTDAALSTLRPYADGQRLRAVYALHGALIADLAGRTADAARLYRVAQTDFGDGNLRLAEILASWQARQGHAEEAASTLAGLASSGDTVAIALPALQAQMAARPVARAADGLAETYLTLAAALTQQDQSEFSMLLLRLSLDLKPDLTPARLLLADLMENAKHPAAALHALSSVGAADPLFAVVRLRRANLQEQLGQTEAAQRDLEQMARDYPDSPAPYVQEGDALRIKNRFAEAAVAYDHAIERMTTPTRAAWPVFYARGIAFERSHQWEKAEADMQRALDLAPDQPFVLNYLAYSWADQGQHLGRAREMIERAIAQRPSDGAIIDSLGWVELRQGETGAAIGTLERAAEMEPEDSTINGHLGDAYWAANRRREAEYQWRQALNLNPDPEDKVKLEEKLHGVSADAAPAVAGRSEAAPAEPSAEPPASGVQ